jgi:hypothetical protein
MELLRRVIFCEASGLGFPSCEATLMTANSDLAVRLAMDAQGWLRLPHRDLCPAHKVSKGVNE